VCVCVYERELSEGHSVLLQRR